MSRARGGGLEHALPESLKLTGSETLFHAFSWIYFLKSSKFVKKAKTPRILRDDKDFVDDSENENIYPC